MGRILEGSLGGAKDIEKPVPKIICTVKMQRFKHFQVYTLVTYSVSLDFGFWRTLIMQRWRSCKKNKRQYWSDPRRCKLETAGKFSHKSHKSFLDSAVIRQKFLPFTLVGKSGKQMSHLKCKSLDKMFGELNEQIKCKSLNWMVAAGCDCSYNLFSSFSFLDLVLHCFIDCFEK